MKSSNLYLIFKSTEFTRIALSFFVLLLFIAFFPNLASAAAPCTANVSGGIQFGGGFGASLGGCKEDPIGALFRQITSMMTGVAGKALCSIAIILAGIGAAFGRVTWMRALVIAAGVALIFGTTSVLHMVTGGANQGIQAVVDGSDPTDPKGTCDDPTTLFAGGGGGLNIPGGGTFALNHVCDTLRTLVNVIASTTGQGIATLAVLILGLSALFGKLSPGQAILAATGIALVFGAVQIVNMFWDYNNSNSDCLMNQIANIGKPELVLCRFLHELRGDSARFLATIAVMILGFLAMIGRLQWQTAIVCFVGIATVYGSDAIMNIIAPAAIADCNNISRDFAFVGLGAIEGVLCSVVRMISGEAGRALGSAAIVTLGFGAMLGKINFGAALTVAVGIAIAFGAPHFVFILTGQIDQCVTQWTVTASWNICSVGAAVR